MAKQHKCPLCGHEIEKKAEKKAKKKLKNVGVKSSDLVVYDRSIYWRIDDSYGNLGACVGDGLSSALSSSAKKLMKSPEFYAVELVAAILAKKVRATTNGRIGWKFSSDGAARKAKTEIAKAADSILSKDDIETAFAEAKVAAKLVLNEPEDGDDE